MSNAVEWVRYDQKDRLTWPEKNANTVPARLERVLYEVTHEEKGIREVEIAKEFDPNARGDFKWVSIHNRPIARAIAWKYLLLNDPWLDYIEP